MTIKEIWDEAYKAGWLARDSGQHGPGDYFEKSDAKKAADAIEAELQKFDALKTGDEIHFINGEVWSCTEQSWAGMSAGAVLVKGAFKDQGKRGFEPGPGETLFCLRVLKPILADAVRGGAKVVPGVGLCK